MSTDGATLTQLLQISLCLKMS